MKRIFTAFLFLAAGSSAATLQEGEWFFNDDPGVGEGTPFSASLESSVTIPPTSMEALEPGTHHLGVRFRDDEGSWGHTVWRSFLRTATSAGAASLAAGEWFLNHDPGVGMGHAFSLAAEEFSIALEAADLEALPLGTHQLGIRLQDHEGRWGHPHWRTFLKVTAREAIPTITAFDCQLLQGEERMPPFAALPATPAEKVGLTVNHGKEGLQVGTNYRLQVIPWDSEGQRGHPVLVEFEYRRYADVWSFTFFTQAERANLAISGDDADPDGDGLSNAEERAFALNPRDGSDAASGAPSLTREEGGLSLSFRVPGGGILSSNGIYQTSDLSWSLTQGLTPTANAPLPAEWLQAWRLMPAPDGSARLQVQLTPDDAPRRFFRMREN